MTQDAILAQLWAHTEEYISGEALAETLGVSRTAVWKEINRLREAGYRIESVTNRGYRLLPEGDVLSAAGVEHYLSHKTLDLRYYDTIGSTNTALKGMAAQGAAEGLTLIAARQTEGRGRLGRSFYSPADTGIYMSILLKPVIAAQEATAITACAAVAVAEAIEALSGERAEIKWVNDVFCRGRKVSGILTEASLDLESGSLNYVILGIGINLSVPAGDFPAELQGVAGAVFDGTAVPFLRCRMVAQVLDRFLDYYAALSDKPFFDAYRARSLVLGKEINILAPGRDPEPATAVALDRDFALVVRMADGSTRRLNSGEVSVRVGG